MQASWQILPDSLTPDVYSSQEAAVATDTGRSVKTDYIGRGILRPFRRVPVGGFESGSGERLIRAAVGLVLNTMCSSENSRGELLWRTEFGSLLQQLRLQNLDGALKSLAQHYVVESLERWVEGVRVTGAKITNVATRGQDIDTMRIVVSYDIIDPPSARVLVPGIQTAVQLG